MRRSLTALMSLATAAVLAVGVTTPAEARPADRPRNTVHLDLPPGFQPEGITVGSSDPKVAYLGSRADGDLVRLDLRNGKLETISQGPGTPSVGLKVDDLGRLFVAGGSGGDVRVVDSGTGEVLASYDLVEGASFLNDVVLTDDAAYVTDSLSAQLFEIPIGAGGQLPARDGVRRIPLGGQWVQDAGLNANGLTETPDGQALLVVNSASGVLYRVDKASGDATPVDLGGAVLTAGDGLLLEGTRLYAVQNRFNRIAVVDLSADGRSGALTRTITSPDFDVPTTVARSGKRLFLPNARFTTPATPTTPYWVTGVGVR